MQMILHNYNLYQQKYLNFQQTLDEMARQPHVKYTTVENSLYQEYFENIADAEDKLFKKWELMTDNVTSIDYE